MLVIMYEKPLNLSNLKMTSLFYGVNWCQFYPFVSISMNLYVLKNFLNVDIKGLSCISYT